MSDEKILDEEIMSDEELDNVAGGMYEATTTIRNKNFLIERGLARITFLAQKFSSTRIIIQAGDKTIDAINSFRLKRMDLKEGQEIKISAKGPGEKEAVITLTNLISRW